MQTPLFFDLTGDARHMSVHFCEPHELAEVSLELLNLNVARFEIDGARLSSSESIFKAFAIVFQKPKGLYGDEEYASNADAFLEYLDDVIEWVPAKGHVAVINNSETFWREQPRLAGELIELWQCAIHRGATIHLVFVW